MEPIRRYRFVDPDRNEVQDQVADSVETDPEYFMALYQRDERSMDGRFVNSDLFKHTFASYVATKETRNRYNGPVHNASAVLAAERFRRNLSQRPHGQSDTVVFVTGMPGAGKTHMIHNSGPVPACVRMIYEGQLSDPDKTLEKMNQVLDAGFKPVIIVVHVKAETALLSTFKRFDEIGRGASILALSSIQGGLPDSLEMVRVRFRERVTLIVRDNRDRTNPITHIGWHHLPILQSEGHHAQIKERLAETVERLWTSGRITEPAYRQAIGLSPKPTASP